MKKREKKPGGWSEGRGTSERSGSGRVGVYIECRHSSGGIAGDQLDLHTEVAEKVRTLGLEARACRNSVSMENDDQNREQRALSLSIYISIYLSAVRVKHCT